MITIDRVTEISEEFDVFVKEHAPKISEMFGSKFNWNNCPYHLFPKQSLLLVARRGDEITGFMLAWKIRSPLDTNVKILQQQLFYVKPESGRTAYHLFKKFIDIGKAEANHIITTLRSQTNIKPSTLQRWGFYELETSYRLEV